MKCGNCKEEGVTVAHVRECYGVEAKVADAGEPTKRQINFIKALLVERELTVGTLPATFDDADQMIKGLLAQKPVAKVSTKAKHDVPAGYYATPSLTGNNDLDFWKVDRPTEGKWAGYTFVKRVIGGHMDQILPLDSKKRVKSARIARVTQVAAMDAIIAFGVDKSHKLFGTELKFCRECGIHLTDEVSRNEGIGPVCKGNVA
jgi:hypothetical protein